MEKKLLKLLDEFQEAVDDYNHGKTGNKKTFDDDAELSLENFMKWLRFRIIF